MTGVRSTDIRTAAIVGAGPGGVIAYADLRYQGLGPDDVVVFDEHGVPLHAWDDHTSAIAQQFMRSESDGHFLPTDFPGFALIEAIHRRSPAPLLRSAVNSYRPRMTDIVRHGQALAGHFRMEESVRAVRVGRIARLDDPEPHFVLYDTHDTAVGRARHVMLALGHGPLRWPSPCTDQSSREILGDVLWHAYQRKTYDGSRVAVIGSGMAAATEWVNVLSTGGSVVAIRRAEELARQPLSAPRCAFAGPWLDGFHRLDGDERATVLEQIGRGSFPATRDWEHALAQGTRSSRLEMRVGEVVAIGKSAAGAAVSISRGGRDVDVVAADRVIAATGFCDGWHHYEILRQLVGDYSLETHGKHLVLAGDSTVPRLSSRDSVLMVGGAAARWAYPASDSFAGMKYAARRFSLYATGRRRVSVGTWWRMVRGSWPYADREPSTGAEPCASR